MSRRQESSVSSSQRTSSRLANGASSSSSTNQRGTRKRPADEVVIDEENETPNREASEDVVEVVVDAPRKYDTSSFLFQPNEKDVHKFEALSPEVQAQCVKAVCRLFVMRGARKESISRDTVRTVLNDLDPDYKKHAAVVLKRVQQQLYKSLGYVIVSSDSILGMKKTGKSDEYYVANNLSSPKLMKLLNQAKRYNHFNQGAQQRTNRNGASSSSSSQPARARRESSSRPNYNEDGDDNISDEEEGEGGAAAVIGSGGTTIAFVGFLVLVCGTIYTAPQKRITCEDLLAHIRKVDPRFPTRLTTGKDLACPVPELEEQFLSLVKRMQKEHYLVARRPEGDKGEENVMYSLGPRFYLDIGRKELMVQYFQLMDQPIDEYIMKEIEEDAKKEVGETVAADEDHNEAPAARGAASSGGGASSSSSSGNQVAVQGSSSSSSGRNGRK